MSGQSQTRLIEIEQNILAKNDEIAARNRARLEAAGIIAINLMSSPGSGKTTLLVETIQALKDRLPIAVIEGDQQTSSDAARIRETGVPALQINTGKGCHLDAGMVSVALDHMPLPEGGILFIENVGNLVCPAGFDLGEARRVVLASVTEGEDKPLKYPEMFATADAMVISKTDLLPHLTFDVEALVANARKVRPRLDILRTSSTSPDGLGTWVRWLEGLAGQLRHAAE
ncbi:MAG: hydrogenase nickel incorporation protein HypB [Hyphomonas sp.]|uniref:hydrogenase nickel incorporation protein HypB n=1 Tax=Hyphomonas sp. TaxID=87 RepID=UPI003527CD07